MFKMDGLAAFVASVETGSISAAARRLGLAKSVVSERLAEIERVLNTSLLKRTSRKLSLTVDGAIFLPRAVRILQEAAEAQAELAQRRGMLVGKLRISVPVSFSILHLSPVIEKFVSENPGIELTLELDDRFVDVIGDGFDAVLRHGPINDQHIVAEPIIASHRLLVASPTYLDRAGLPAFLSDLGQHRGILYANRDSDWRFGSRGNWTVVRPLVALRCNNGIMIKNASLAGMGIALLPPFVVSEELHSGALVRIDLGIEAEGAQVVLAYPRARRAPATVRAFASCLKRHFKNAPWVG